MLELTSDVGVADGKWHTVLAKFNPTYMEITVDGETETLRPSSAAGRGQGNREDALQCGRGKGRKGRKGGRGYAGADAAGARAIHRPCLLTENGPVSPTSTYLK